MTFILIIHSPIFSLSRFNGCASSLTPLRVPPLVVWLAFKPTLVGVRMTVWAVMPAQVVFSNLGTARQNVWMTVRALSVHGISSKKNHAGTGGDPAGDNGVLRFRDAITGTEQIVHVVPIVPNLAFAWKAQRSVSKSTTAPMSHVCQHVEHLKICEEATSLRSLIVDEFNEIPTSTEAPQRRNHFFQQLADRKTALQPCTEMRSWTKNTVAGDRPLASNFNVAGSRNKTMLQTERFHPHQKRPSACTAMLIGNVRSLAISNPFYPPPNIAFRGGRGNVLFQTHTHLWSKHTHTHISESNLQLS